MLPKWVVSLLQAGRTTCYLAIIETPDFLFSGWVAASILVSKVAKGLVIEAVNFAKTKKTDINQQQTSITYENNDILTLLSTN